MSNRMNGSLPPRGAPGGNDRTTYFSVEDPEDARDKINIGAYVSSIVRPTIVGSIQGRALHAEAPARIVAKKSLFRSGTNVLVSTDWMENQAKTTVEPKVRVYISTSNNTDDLEDNTEGALRALVSTLGQSGLWSETKLRTKQYYSRDEETVKSMKITFDATLKRG